MNQGLCEACGSLPTKLSTTDVNNDGFDLTSTMDGCLWQVMLTQMIPCTTRFATPVRQTGSPWLPVADSLPGGSEADTVCNR